MKGSRPAKAHRADKSGSNKGKPTHQVRVFIYMVKIPSKAEDSLELVSRRRYDPDTETSNDHRIK